MVRKSFRRDLFGHAESKYGTLPEYLWARFPDYAVLRRADNRKWYGAVLDVPRDKLGLSGDDRVDVLNVKIADDGLRLILLQQNGYLPGYHMSKGPVGFPSSWTARCLLTRLSSVWR